MTKPKKKARRLSAVTNGKPNIGQNRLDEPNHADESPVALVEVPNLHRNGIRESDFIEESPISQPSITELLAKYYRAKKPVLLVGETGVGKTMLVQIIADMFSVELIQKMGGDYGVSKLLGHPELHANSGATTRFVPGPLLRAITQGTVFYLDEIDALSGDCYDVLHQLLDHRGTLAKADVGLEVRAGENEFIQTHNDFWFVATCVESGGRSGLPDDFLDRFRVIQVPRLSEQAQLNYLLQTNDIQIEPAIRRFVRVGELTRRLNWNKPASFRQIKAAVDDVLDGFPADFAIDHCLINPNADGASELTSLRETMAIEKLGTTNMLERNYCENNEIKVAEFDESNLAEWDSEASDEDEYDEYDE
jgi:MoxR-like ATPase